jgi:hypothetical protein
LGSGVDATQPLSNTGVANRRPVRAAKPRWRPDVGLAREALASMAEVIVLRSSSNSGRERD